MLSYFALWFTGASLVAAGGCKNPLLRSEWHQLSGDQQSAYVAACQSLASRQDSNQQSDPTKMSWHDFVVAHSDTVFWAHGNAEFYPFHRAMVWMFEQAIISTDLMPPGMGVPYFDWSIKSQTWASSNIFSSSVFGAPSSGDADNCVLDGAFAKGKYAVATGGSTLQYRSITTGDLTCLRRNAVAGSLVDANFLQQELSAASYLQFTCQDPLNVNGDHDGDNYFDESDFHSNGHFGLGGGGDLTNVAVSPNDPVFWLHHSFVDKHWWKWQKQCEQFLYDYSGRLASNIAGNSHNPNWNGVDDNAAINMQLNVWPFTVAQMLDTQGNTLCYTYTELSTDLGPKTGPPTCPSVNKVDTPGPLSDGSSSVTTSTVATTTNSQAGTTATRTGSAAKSVSITSASTTLTISTAATESNSAETVFQIVNILLALISQSKEGNVALFNRRDASAIETNDPDDEIDSVEPPFNSITNADNSTTFFYTTHNRNVTVPGTHTPMHVYNGHVVAQCNDTGKWKRFYPYSEVKPYIPDPDAPQNVTVGQSACWLAPPPKMSRDYVEGMNKNWARYETQYHKLLMKYDTFNKDNCTNEYIQPQDGVKIPNTNFVIRSPDDNNALMLSQTFYVEKPILITTYFALEYANSLVVFIAALVHYIAVLALTTVLALFGCEIGGFNLPWWGTILAMVLALVSITPIGIIQAISGQQIGLNVMSEFFIILLPDRISAVVALKTFSYTAMYQGLTLVVA
ncbi:hypothetical protein BC830DRAFT_1231467 [Chytriomyces sp. MP71]|nr:hypothetical protein BC830DRAFT_1231467 [Chytriomyces sp. MP71]